MKKRVQFPNTNWGWYRYYVNRYNRTGSLEAYNQANLYFLFHVAFGDTPVPA